MSRYIEAYKGFNKTKIGFQIWCVASTQSSLFFDAYERILFDTIVDSGYRLVELKQIKNNLEYYKDWLKCFNSELKGDIINHLVNLIHRAEKNNMRYILFKIG